MRRNHATPLALVATLFIGGFSVAWAGDDFRPGDLERLAVQSHRLERAARHLERDAAHFGYYRGFPRVLALHELREFRRATKRFHNAIEDSYVDVSRLERRYRELIFAFEDAEWAAHRLRRTGHLGRSFRDVDRQMRRVIHSYRDVTGTSVHNTRRRADREDEFNRPEDPRRDDDDHADRPRRGRRD